MSSLCPVCTTISVPSLTSELHHLPPWLGHLRTKSNKPRGMVHLHDARHLPASASAGCPFCCLIVNAVLQHQAIADTAARASHASLAHSLGLVELPIYLQTNYDPIKPSFPENGIPGAWHIRGLKALVPTNNGLLVGRIRLHATQDSPAAISSDVIGRPLLPSSESPEAFDLCQRWMVACLAKHPACRNTLAGSVVDESTPPVMPSRIIHVGNPDHKVFPRLLETAGKTGHYVALSHCWGPPAHKPLMTTLSSLADHLAGIPWSKLPKSYQDAFTVTRRLGFEYIWIDSLCIIQDSLPDWLSESQHMGDVYQRARLTIAASHAVDSSQPCFFTRPPPPTAVELPYVAKDGSVEGAIFASVLFTNYDAISPESSPLACRAWATQEWLLSRRMIFYTAESLVWSCKTITQFETGASFHLTARNSRWKSLIEKYSARQLTIQTDRLIALEGIKAEMAKLRTNDIYCCGLWKNSMPDQLLWYCLQSSKRVTNELDLPTWTWASTTGGVGFVNITNAKNACESFAFDKATNTLTIRGMMINMAGATLVTEAGSTKVSHLMHDVGPAALVSSPIHNITDAKSGRILGWCIFDTSVQTIGPIYSLRLMSCTTRLRDKEVDKRHYKEWILLLQHTNKISGVFERLGVGIITTTSLWFRDCEISPVCIC